MEWLLSHTDEPAEPSSSMASSDVDGEAKEGNGDSAPEAKPVDVDENQKAEEAKSLKCNE